MTAWNYDGSGLWFDAAKWDAGVPNSDTVFVTFFNNTPGSTYYDIDLVGATPSVNSLTLYSSSSRGWSLSDGTLSMSGANAIIHVIAQGAGANLETTFYANLNLAVFTSVDVRENASLNVAGDIQGSGGLVLDGGGTLAISRADVSRTGGTEVFIANLDLKAANAIGSGYLMVFGTGSTVDIHGNSQSIGTLSGNAGGLIQGTEGAVLSVNQSADAEYGGVLSGGLGLTKTGAARLTLSQVGEFGGATTVSAGTLELTNGYALIDSSGVDVAAGATLSLNEGYGATYELSRLTGAGAVTMSHGGAATLILDNGDLFEGAITDGSGDLSVQTGGGVTYFTSNSNSYSGGTTINSGTVVIGAGGTTGSIGTGTVTVNSGAIFGLFRSDDFTFKNALAGAGTFEKNLSGIATIESSNSGFTGAIKVNGGTLRTTNSGALGAASSVYIANGAVLDVVYYVSRINNLSGAGTVLTTPSNPTLQLYNSANTTFSGALSGGTFLQLRKTGVGTLTLTSSMAPNNWYIEAGKLAFAGAATVPNSFYKIYSGGTLDFAGLTNHDVTIRDLELLSGGAVVLGGHALTIQDINYLVTGGFVGSAAVDSVTFNLDSAYGHYSIPYSLSFASFNNWNDASDRITVNGSSYGESITGSSHADRINGNGGADYLDGNGGVDTMVGGIDDDTYVVDNIGDVVIELNGQGTDTVQSSVSYSLVTNFADNLTLTGSANIDAIGNGLNNVLTGNSGINTLTGGRGDDTYVVNNTGDIVVELNGRGMDLVQSSVTYSLATNFAENLTLTGSDNIDGTGNGLNNILTGNSGINTLIGGSGDDTYVVNNTGDIVVELNGRGMDLVQSSVTYSLATNFAENLTLTGSDNIDATGNGLNNVLTGNAGINTLSGGLGDDTYVVNNIGDVVVELYGKGTDLVQSAVTYSLATNFAENLTLTGSDNIDATGNGLGNILTGNSGINTLSGGLGDDTYIVNNTGDVVIELNGKGTDLVQSSVSYSIASNFVENLTLTGVANIDSTGNGLANILTGNAGNNSLNGGVGADTLVGGSGDDTYVVDDAADVVTELYARGIDLVQSSVTYSLATNFADNLTLTGSANIDATGNGLGNILTGNSGINTLSGGLGNDTYIVNNIGDVVVELFGKGTDLVQSSVSYSIASNFVDNLTLTGSTNIDATGNGLGNILTGNSGINTLSGGLGDDTYVVNNTGDVVVELNGKGTDLVQSSVTYSLAANFADNLTLTGSANIDATGNGLGNVLTGNAGINTLDGGAGDDELWGGTGLDTFVFGASSGVDVIRDFSAADGDVIDLRGAIAASPDFATYDDAFGNTIITFGGGATITVLGVGAAVVSGHLVYF